MIKTSKGRYSLSSDLSLRSVESYLISNGVIGYIQAFGYFLYFNPSID